MPKHVALTGMMGSGKSTVAPFLAELLGRRYTEIDKLVEQHEQMPITAIFNQLGEAHFRKVEQKVIRDELSSDVPAILSLGGGAFLWSETRSLLLERTAVFYLAAKIDTLVKRLAVEVDKRPLLANPEVDLTEKVTKLLEFRDPYYRRAHVVIGTDTLMPDQVAEEIVRNRELFD